jgi:hypothetical protein
MSTDQALKVSETFRVSPAPSSDDLVLVTLINNQRDFARARDEHWYRIPLRHAPRRAVGAPWLAFYQTKSFGDDKWSVRCYAAALSWDVITRAALLPDEPGHPRAHEQYYRIALGPLQDLPHPIAARSWKRVTFIVTHWAQIERAWDLGDLLQASVLERGLWRALEKIRSVRDDNEEWVD